MDPLLTTLFHLLQTYYVCIHFRPDICILFNILLSTSLRHTTACKQKILFYKIKLKLLKLFYKIKEKAIRHRISSCLTKRNIREVQDCDGLLNVINPILLQFRTQYPCCISFQISKEYVLANVSYE